MKTQQTIDLSGLSSFFIRPTLAEARLISEKHARDTVYLATLTDELRRIEQTIAALEGKLESEFKPTLNSPATDETSLPTLLWIREKSAELEKRWSRLEHTLPGGSRITTPTRGKRVA